MSHRRVNRATKPDWRDRRIAAPGPYLCLCVTAESFAAALDDIGATDRPAFMATGHAHATTHSFEHKDGGIACIVTLGDCSERSPIEVAGLLVHEAVHVFQMYCERIGEHRPGREQEAYGIQSIAQELMQSFAEQAAC